MSQKDLGFGKTLLAGGIAGGAEVLLMYPLDTLKTRAQQAEGKPISHVRYIRDMLRTEGPLRFYRGILAPLVQEPLKRSVKFVSNKFYNDLVFGSNNNDDPKKKKKPVPPTLAKKALCGFLAGATEATCISPFEAVKIRMQARNRVNMYTSSWHCAQTMWRNEGVFGFIRGLDASFARSGVWNATYFATIFELQKRKTFGDSTFLPGFVGGCLGVCFNHPLDVVVARVRNILPPNPHLYPVRVLRDIWTTEGPLALYKGFLPKILRLGPGGGLMIVVFDWMSQWLA